MVARFRWKNLLSPSAYAEFCDGKFSIEYGKSFLGYAIRVYEAGTRRETAAITRNWLNRHLVEFPNGRKFRWVYAQFFKWQFVDESNRIIISFKAQYRIRMVLDVEITPAAMALPESLILAALGCYFITGIS